MIQGDLFRNSQLEMSAVPIPGADLQTDWSSLLANRILVVTAILAILINLPNFFRIFGSILHCMRIARANSILEHSYSQAMMRNQTAWAHLIPIALLADRFDIIGPAVFDRLDPVWHSLLTLGMILAFLMVRFILFTFFKPHKMSAEAGTTVHRILFTFSITLGIIALATTGIMLIFNAPDTAIRSALLWETGIIWFLSLIRTGQILGTSCRGFSTFLYLCAFEIVPAAGLVAATTML